jgi:hypothetical protein
MQQRADCRTEVCCRRRPRGPRRTSPATVSCGPRQAPQSPTTRACPELSSPRRAADALANFAPVRARPTEKAEVEVTMTQLAHVCEPKAALAIKHEVVGTFERVRTAAFVKALDLARGDIDDVNSAARVGFALPAWAKRRALADPAISAAIADEDSAVRPYGGPILGARDLRDNLEFSVRMRTSESSRSISTTSTDRPPWRWAPQESAIRSRKCASVPLSTTV